MKYELRCGTRTGRYFIDKIESGEGFTILTENYGVWERNTVDEIETLIDKANQAELLTDYALHVRQKVSNNEMPLTLDKYEELLAELEAQIN